MYTLDSGGSGNVRTGVKSVNTGTLSRQDSFLNLSGRPWKRPRRPTQSVWKSSWKSKYAFSHFLYILVTRALIDSFSVTNWGKI